MVVIGKLIGGMLVIGELTSEGNIEDAMEVGIVPVGPAQMRVAIQPLMAPFSDKTRGYTVRLEHIVATDPAKKDLEDSYMQAKTGIVMANAVPK